MKRILKIAVFSGFWLVLSGGAHGAESVPAAAQEILSKASVPAGLCVHLGSGSPEAPGLTAELAAGGSFLVHGLAVDDAALARARQAISEKKLEGRAFAERIELKQLPFLSDMVNLLVVENPGEVAKLGITEAELLRVVAPNGVLCRRAGGKWTSTVKPMPTDFDEWSHIEHGADGNNVSFDKRIAPPFGVRWLDGIRGYAGFGYLGSFGWIVAGGRCFVLGPSVEENVGKREDQRAYLVARDAYNGLPLWKINCGYMLPGDNRFNVNAPPLASDGLRVYAPYSNQVVALDAASGRIMTRFETTYPAGHLLVTNRTLVVACWENTVMKGDKWQPKANAGSVEGFDAESGKRLWTVTGAADKLLAAGGVAYLAILGQVNQPACSLAAVDLKTGKELWKKEGGDDWFINCAVADGVIAYERHSKMLRLLDAKDGRPLWEMNIPVRTIAPAVGVFGQELWCGNAIYDVKTGKKTGATPSGLGMGSVSGACADTRFIDRRMTASGKGAYTYLGPNGKAEAMVYSGVRRACGPGDAIAYGSMYISQGRCMGCARGQVLGFRSIGSLGEWPAKAEMEASRPVEQGPAFGQGLDMRVEPDAWPQFRHDAERSSCTGGLLPEKLQELWRLPLQGAGDPVSAHGMVFVAQKEAGRVVAADSASGKQVWCATFGSRVQAPAVWRGLCLVGCADGWLYALSVKDGRLAWRTRCAPRERRMVAFGRVESSWPIEGSPMVDGDVVYVSAGRTSQSDGGVAEVAVDAATGKTVWARQFCNLANLSAFRNTCLIKVGDTSILHTSNLLLKDGSTVTNAPQDMWFRTGDWGRVGALAWNRTQVFTGSGIFPVPDVSDSWDACRKKPVWRRSEALAPSPWSANFLILAGNAALYAGSAPGKQGVRGFISIGASGTGLKLAGVDVDAPVTGIAVGGQKLYATTGMNLICYGDEQTQK